MALIKEDKDDLNEGSTDAQVQTQFGTLTDMIS